MSGSRKSNTRISKLHERALRIMYNDYETLFSDLLGNDDSSGVLHTNVQTRLTEMCKVKHDISGNAFKDLLTSVDPKCSE